MSIYALWGNIFCGFLLVIWSQDIGDEAVMEPAAPVPVAAEHVSTGKAVLAKGGRSTRPALPTERGDSIDAKAFQFAFKRQAALELLACLREWRAPPASLGLAATLARNGRLSHVRILGGGSEAGAALLPDCAKAAINRMEFPELVRSLERETVDLDWRIDW